MSTVSLQGGFEIVTRPRSGGLWTAEVHCPAGRVLSIPAHESEQGALSCAVRDLAAWWMAEASHELVVAFLDRIPRQASNAQAGKLVGVEPMPVSNWRNGKRAVSGPVRSHLLRIMGIGWNMKTRQWELL